MNRSAFLAFLGTAVCLALGVSPARAEVKMPPIFGDHMVLQQDLKLPVWGTAEPGEKVAVAIADRHAATTADAHGNWTVRLDPLATTRQGVELTVTGTNTLTFHDVLVGDVWVCSGQSNMEFPIGRAFNSDAVIAAADHPQLRLFVVAHQVALQPATGFAGAWLVCTPENLKKLDFSAVGYFFGQEIQETRKVPVGLIGSEWGGTPAQSWTSIEALRANPELKHYAEAMDKTNATLTQLRETYDKETFPAWKKAHDVWDARYGAAHTAAMAKWKEDIAKATAEGQPTFPGPKPPERELPRPLFATEDHHQPTVLFNGMIAPLIPYGLKGVIWYQGESNATVAKEYATLFPAMITDWRQRWGVGDFPFLFVQIAGYANSTMWPELREAQRQTLSLPRTGMAVALDVGEEKDIHPRNKADVGHRLALSARRVAYGETLVDSGPVFDHLQRENSHIRVTFRSVGGGLVIGSNPTGHPKAAPRPLADRVEGFEVAGADGNFVPARAEIKGADVVVVSADGVAAPETVRYGWKQFPTVNLYNKEGLPAGPFQAK